MRSIQRTLAVLALCGALVGIPGCTGIQRGPNLFSLAIAAASAVGGALLIRQLVK